MRPVTPCEQIKSCISLIPESDRKRGISTYRKTFGNIFHIQQEKTFPFTIHNPNSRIPGRETINIRETQLGIFPAFLQQQFTLNIIHTKHIFPRINKLILPVTLYVNAGILPECKASNIAAEFKTLLENPVLLLL